ncbi:hypothetical protein BJ508DRAFT_311810 [Ascobolus immersus RN42]|uniref:NACHT domain-containing protein n=1 Tax=Ascobolus immersus RN42 TaxID=1160509 RepID=A0A3N4HUV5_ASCIM|nr:hypothetical protein BJ508DRAFT_311810 [Ascobolus immersus RN42]
MSLALPRQRKAALWSRAAQIAANEPREGTQRTAYDQFQQHETRFGSSSTTGPQNFIQRTSTPAPSSSSATPGSAQSSPAGVQPHTPDVYNQCFKDAMAKFLLPLGKQEMIWFKECKTPAEFQSYLGTVEALASSPRRGEPLLAKIHKLSSRLEPYFKIVEIILQTDPKWSSIAWGGFRLILQLACNFTKFFEKLLDSIATVGKLLPRYEELLTVWKDPKEVPQRVRDIIAQIFVCLMTFFSDTVGIFIKRDRCKKSTARLVVELAWYPFEQRFKDFQECLRNHQETLNDEISVQHLKLTAEMRDIQAKEREARTKDIQDEHLRNAQLTNLADLLVFQAKIWVSPPEFLSDYEEARELKEEGTCEWLLADTTFNAWKDFGTPLPGVFGVKGWDKEVDLSRFLWVPGHPGCGKTVLCASVIEELKLQSGASDNLQSVFYFFFNHNTPTKQRTDSALRAVLGQLLQQFQRNREILDRISFVIGRQDGGQLVASERELEELLSLCLSTIGRVYLVFDGIDECKDDAKFMKSLQEIAKKTNSDIRFLLFSRPHVKALHEAFPESCRYFIQKAGPIRRDIRCYLKRSIEDMIQSELLYADDSRSDVASLVAQLESGSDGMFLWARLMMSYLEIEMFSREERLNIILSVRLLEGLDAMFARILARIDTGPRLQRQYARHIFTWLSFKTTEMTLEEFYTALSIDFPSKLEERQDKFETSLILSCYGLVETTKDPERCPRFIHLSVTEYFRGYTQRTDSSNSTKGSEFRFPSPFDAEVKLSNAYFKYVMDTLPPHPLAGEYGKPASKMDWMKSTPFLSKALSGSLFHLRKSAQVTTNHSMLLHTDLGSLISRFQKFLTVPLRIMAWVEAQYLYGIYLKEAVEVFNTWSSWLEQLQRSSICENSHAPSLCETLRRFTRDLSKLIIGFHETLMRQPHAIWGDITGFFNSEFFVQCNSALKVKSIINTPKQNEYEPPDGVSTAPLCEISRSTGCLERTATLRIFPSKPFAQNTEALQWGLGRSSLTSLCSSWVAVYEVHSIRSEEGNQSTLLLRASIELNDMDVLHAVELYLSGKRGPNAPCSSDFISVDYEREGIRLLYMPYSVTAVGLHFPMSIGGPNLELFSVLRTVFSVGNRLDHHSVPTSASPIVVQPKLLLSLAVNELKKQKESLSESFNKQFLGFEKNKKRQFAYLYGITISPDGKYIILQQGIYLDKESGIRTSCWVSIHALGGPVSSARPLLTYISQPKLFQAGELRFYFCRKSSRVAFYSDRMIHVWGISPDHEVRLAFSECGFFIILENKPALKECSYKCLPLPAATPSVGLMPKHPVGLAPCELVVEDIMNAKAATSNALNSGSASLGPATNALQNLALEKSAMTSSSSDRSMSVRVTDSNSRLVPTSDMHDGRQSAASVNISRMSVEVQGQGSQIIALRSGSMDTQLLTVPTSDEYGGRDRMVSAKMSAGMLKVVLDKPLRKFYDLPSDSSPGPSSWGSALPALIEKDTRAIVAQNSEVHSHNNPGLDYLATAPAPELQAICHESSPDPGSGVSTHGSPSMVEDASRSPSRLGCHELERRGDIDDERPAKRARRTDP